MKKRCIWNWYRTNKIDYLEERGKGAKLETVFCMCVAIVTGVLFVLAPLIVMGIWLFDIVVYRQVHMLISLILFLPPFMICAYAVWELVYGSMISDGVYYLNERGIQIEYYSRIFR